MASTTLQPIRSRGIQSQLSTGHPIKRNGGSVRPRLPSFFSFSLLPLIVRRCLSILHSLPVLSRSCCSMPVSSRRPLPEQLDTPLDLAPLTDESLEALRNLASHVPHPSTEPCPESVPAFRRAAVLLGIFGSRKGCVYAVQGWLSPPATAALTTQALF